MAIGMTKGVGNTGPNRGGYGTAQGGYQGPTGPKTAQVTPMPAPPSLSSLLGGGGGAAAKPAKGAFTQKNGKWFDSAGNELQQGQGGFTVKSQPQQNSGFNFSFGGGSYDGSGINPGGGSAPKGTGGVGQSKGGYDGSGINGGRPGGGGFTNATSGDPNISKATQMMQARYAQQTAQEGQVDPFQMESINNLRRQQGTDQTQRATDQATSAIRDFGAGQQEVANVRRAQMGQGGGASGQIAQSGQRAQAKAAADIQMGEMARQDQLALGGASILNAPGQMNLARQGQNNALLGSLYGGADMQGKMNLGQGGLGLEAWKAQNNPAYDKQFQSQLMQQQLAQGQLGLQGQQLGLYGDYLKLLQGSGYGGAYGY